ncbi:MAG: hypothetical protein JJ978_14120 [Roseivirga sp.]|jgi:hypothetical protein|uniref:hypothetical protein n=1 Tax=Roseivirga sp. TaxID=1964215 RepID=UPI001B135CA4|nr:hypothetical protein [Roseivirga sp.]MBO6496705.1 hypothetical protein [Roseivirga sp.]
MSRAEIQEKIKSLLAEADQSTLQIVHSILKESQSVHLTYEEKQVLKERLASLELNEPELESWNSIKSRLLDS